MHEYRGSSFIFSIKWSGLRLCDTSEEITTHLGLEASGQAECLEYISYKEAK